MGILCVLLVTFFLLSGGGGWAAGVSVPVRKVVPVGVVERDAEGWPFLFPIGVALDPYNWELYVADPGRSKITVYSPDLFPRYSLGKGRGLHAPYGVAVDEEGRVYVCQASGVVKGRLTVLNGAGLVEKEYVFEDYSFEGARDFRPRAVAIDRRYIYVAGEDYRGVVVLDREEGRFVRILTVKDRVAPGLPEEKARLNDVYVDRKGRLYLLSADMGRFYVFDSRGHFLFKGGQKGGSPGKLSRPSGVAADPNLGLILVIDYMRHTGVAYSYENGRLLFEFGGRGWSPGWFNYPTDIAVDPKGRIYVADLFNRRVQVLVLGGEAGVYSPVPSFITPLKPLEEKGPGRRPKKKKEEGVP